MRRQTEAVENNVSLGTDPVVGRVPAWAGPDATDPKRTSTGAVVSPRLSLARIPNHHAANSAHLASRLPPRSENAYHTPVREASGAQAYGGRRWSM
jgi:hypothetical protein